MKNFSDLNFYLKIISIEQAAVNHLIELLARFKNCSLVTVCFSFLLRELSRYWLEPSLDNVLHCRQLLLNWNLWNKRGSKETFLFTSNLKCNNWPFHNCEAFRKLFGSNVVKILSFGRDCADCRMEMHKDGS